MKLKSGYFWFHKAPRRWEIGYVESSKVRFADREIPLRDCPQEWSAYGPLINPFDIRFLAKYGQKEATQRDWALNRKKLGLTQQAMAKKMGLSQWSVSRFENRGFPVHLLEKALNFYGFKGGESQEVSFGDWLQQQGIEV